MKKFLRLGEKLLPVTLCGADIGKFALVLHSTGSVKGPPEMPAWTEKAGKIFKEYIYRISGVELPVYYDIYPLKREREILIGGTLRDCDDTANACFEKEEYRFYTRKGNLIINGGCRGILYGVYTFLEKYCGVRYFTDTVEKIAENDKIIIDDIDESYLPVFEYRELCDWNAWQPDFSVKMKLNGNFVRKLREEDGYSVGFAGGFGGLVHTFGRLIPPERYYREHPEYYALTESGVRDPSGLCFSDREMFSELLKNAKNWLKAEKNPTLLSLSINDGNIAFCQCEKCRKIYAAGGNQTDAVLDFVNRFARRIRKTYPNVMVDTISYGQTEDPPKIIVPDDNVAVRVCTWCAGNYTIPEAVEKYRKTGDKKAEKAYNVAKRINRLSEIAEKIYIWDYPYSYQVINCHYPVLGVLRENYRYFADHKVKGVFINGETDTADFVSLKVYLLSKLLYNPYMSREEFDGHYEDFLYGFYGQGGRYIKEYLSYTENLGRQADIYMSVTPNCEIFGLKLYDDGTYDDTFIRKSRTLFDKALACAETDSERARIRKAALVVDSYELYYCMDHVMRNGSEERKNEFIERNRKYYREIIDTGIPRITENTFFPVVKNFRQSPFEWEYWDSECLTGDRNNEKYARELYILIPVEKESGSTVSGEFLCKTNNENEKGYYRYWTKDGFFNSNENLTWENTREYDKLICIDNALVTNVYEFALAQGIALDDLRINLIPRHLNGIILKIEEMDSGAYIFIRNKR